MLVLNLFHGKQISLSSTRTGAVSTVRTQCNENVLDTKFLYTVISLSLQFFFLSVDMHVLPSCVVSVSLSFVNFCSGRVYYSLVFLSIFLVSFSFFFPSEKMNCCRQRRHTYLRLAFVLHYSVVRVMRGIEGGCQDVGGGGVTAST